MSESKIYSFIGLARKAGALCAGEGQTEGAVKSHKAVLVLITEDASGNTRKKFQNACKSQSVECLLFGTKVQLGEMLGKEMISVVAITDQRFSEKIREMVNNHIKGNTAHGGGFFEQTENS